MGLEIATWKEYQGPALVKYDRIQIDSAKQKFCLERDVERWKRIFKSDPSCIDKWDNAPIIAVSQEALEDARRIHSTSNDEGQTPWLKFQKRQLLCLDGQSRIRAALSSILGPGTSGFGPVHIVLNSEYGQACTTGKILIRSHERYHRFSEKPYPKQDPSAHHTDLWSNLFEDSRFGELGGSTIQSITEIYTGARHTGWSHDDTELQSIK